LATNARQADEFPARAAPSSGTSSVMPPAAGWTCGPGAGLVISTAKSRSAVSQKIAAKYHVVTAGAHKRRCTAEMTRIVISADDAVCIAYLSGRRDGHQRADEQLRLQIEKAVAVSFPLLVPHREPAHAENCMV
jgi:hypothetical protein